MENQLKYETSPYLLQHKENPVNWQPWGEKAFEQARKEDKPVFLSIGYSTCHWCHVMAHESFEDAEVAAILNQHFVSIKVDKEQRPDIDSIYMNVCQAFTGSGGWPMSVFLTPDQKPIYAGTYFPKEYFIDMLKEVHMLWQTQKEELISAGDEVVRVLNNAPKAKGTVSGKLIEAAFKGFSQSFDSTYGGFGHAPKFPTPHNLLFLMDYYENTKDSQALLMVEKTLMQMYKGGIFDHIGFGFSRYSTDQYFLAPHFEKMLYDNALLMLCYTRAYEITKKEIYKEVTKKTADYILREMTSPEGGFYSAQDADSEGVEGKYYTFDYQEIIDLLGEEAGERFNQYYDITEGGNFEGKNIPNLLKHDNFDNSFEVYFNKLYDYRRQRTSLHLDDKILTSWNSLMIAAFSLMYRVLKEEKYLEAAKNACKFIEKNLSDGNETLFVSWRDGKHSEKGFLDDYAFYIFALLHLYEASLEQYYLDKAALFCKKAMDDFYDRENSGFYLYGTEHEQLILKPKEIYDGAIPSGNSVMAYNLVRLYQITEDETYEKPAEEQLAFLTAAAKEYPMGHSFFLFSLSMFLNPPMHITCVLNDTHETFPLHAAVKIIHGSQQEYPMINDKTTYYVCKDKSCLPPVNNLKEILAEEGGGIIG